METMHILRIIAEKDFPVFLSEWKSIKDQLTEKEKQKLIFEILEDQYSDDSFGFYVKVLDKIIESKVSLDFNIDNWAPTLLSLTVHLVSRQLFDYFLQKGASLNYIGDYYAFESDETIQREVGDSLSMRYETCLDFAENKLADALTTDYNYHDHIKTLGGKTYRQLTQTE